MENVSTIQRCLTICPFLTIPCNTLSVHFSQHFKISCNTVARSGNTIQSSFTILAQQHTYQNISSAAHTYTCLSKDQILAQQHTYIKRSIPQINMRRVSKEIFSSIQNMFQMSDFSSWKLPLSILSLINVDWLMSCYRIEPWLQNWSVVVSKEKNLSLEAIHSLPFLHCAIHSLLVTTRSLTTEQAIHLL